MNVNNDLKKINITFVESAEDGNFELVKEYHKKGADINALYNGRFNGLTALIVSAAQGFDNIVKYLIENGADPNIELKDGRTALYFAAVGGYYQVVELLLRAGAKVDKRYQSAGVVQPLLKMVKMNHHEDIVDLLKKYAIEDDEIQKITTPLIDANCKNCGGFDWRKDDFIKPELTDYYVVYNSILICGQCNTLAIFKYNP